MMSVRLVTVGYEVTVQQHPHSYTSPSLSLTHAHTVPRNLRASSMMRGTSAGISDDLLPV